MTEEFYNYKLRRGISLLETVAFLTFGTSWLLGIGSIMNRAYSCEVSGECPTFVYMPEFDYGNYVAGAVDELGDNLLTRSLATLAYPSAQAGRYIYNRMVDSAVHSEMVVDSVNE